MDELETMYSKFYFVLTEESLSWLGGWIELPADVGNGIEGLGPTIPMGLDIDGLWETMLSGGLGTEPAMFMPILLVGNDEGITLDDEAGKPSLAAIICARSW